MHGFNIALMKKFSAKHHDQLEQEVVNCLIRLTSGEAMSEDFAELATWQARSPAHSLAYHKVSALWEHLDKPLIEWHQKQNVSIVELQNQQTLESNIPCN
jgi:ferric-dicitrate binding protein FerR (iron transport regulator)